MSDTICCVLLDGTPTELSCDPQGRYLEFVRVMPGGRWERLRYARNVGRPWERLLVECRDTTLDQLRSRLELLAYALGNDK